MTQHPLEIAYTPASPSWLNRIEAQFTALREFTLNGPGHERGDDSSGRQLAGDRDR
jgi:hypothetical protein